MCMQLGRRELERDDDHDDDDDDGGDGDEASASLRERLRERDRNELFTGALGDGFELVTSPRCYLPT